MVIGFYNFGKEMLFYIIVVVFKIWIGVDFLRKEILKFFEMLNVFICDVDKVRIRVVKSYEVIKKNF